MAGIPKIPGYKIEKKLGEGGMSTVYMGIQEKLNRKVAIKILDPSLLKNKVIEIRFLQEAETAANMYHSNIISIYDIGRVGDHSYIVMEFLEETLKDHMLGHLGFCLKPVRALEILKPIVVALDYAHSRGIIHRDIKTDNIMFRADGTPVLTDFGIARALDSDKEMTRTGMSLGTPFYMSPEQCKAEPLDGRSDIYSLGVVLFEVLTGTKPYDADSPMAVALKHVQDPIPQLPGELKFYQPLIDKMMAKSKEDRVSSGLELIKLMDSVHQQAQQGAAEGAGPVPKPVPDTVPEPEFEAVPEPVAETVPRSVSEPEPVPETIPVAVSEPEPVPETVPEPVTELELDYEPIPEGLIVTTPVSVPAVTLPRTTPKPKLLLGKYPLKKVLEIGVLMVLLVAVFVIFFSLGSGSSPHKNQASGSVSSAGDTGKAAVQPVSPAFSQEFLQQGPQYQADYNHALTLYQNKDFEKALEWVDRLKQLKPVPEVLELEKNINLGLQEAKEADFSTYFANARDFLRQRNFTKARENILLAKGIKDTPEVQALEKRINSAYSKYQSQLKQKSQQSKELQQKDNQTYQLAAAQNTIDAYRSYLDEFPTGQHVEEAIARISKLEEAERLKKEAAQKAAISRVKLRSGYKNNLSLPDVAAMIQQNNFFENEFNKTGTFKNKYVQQSNSGDSVVVDKAADLVWYAGPPPKEMSFKKAEKWVKSLNVKHYAGYSNWRLPTLEEAASLLRKRKNARGLHIDPVFSANIKSIWTGDQQRFQTYWVVRFNEGIVYADSERTDQHVRPVRSGS